MNRRINRRRFLASASVCAAASAVGAFTIVPRHVLGQGQTPPSEKLAIAGIGVGGQGGGLIKEMVGEKVGPGEHHKLLKTINAQAPKIMQQYNAKAVDFSVVVKDNQVIIKAKPKT